MELLDLSTELLIHILSYLGCDFFTQDISRLSISKRWYPIARQALFRNLHLPLTAVSKFNLVVQDERAIAELRDLTRSVDIWVPPIEDWGLKVFEMTEDRLSTAAWNETEREFKEIREGLSSLTKILRESPALHSFRINAHPTLICAATSPMPFVHTPTLASFLSTSHLTSLELDINYLPNNSKEGADSQVHFCSVLNPLLPRLHRFRYHMEKVCPQLLDIPAGDSPFNLKELVIDLGFFELERLETNSGTYASHCTTEYEDPSAELQKMIKSQLKLLVPRLTNPRIVGFMSYPPPSHQKKFYDALQRRWLWISPHGWRWDIDSEADEAILDGEMNPNEISLSTPLEDLTV
jgi:hypothetical protein